MGEQANFPFGNHDLNAIESLYEEYLRDPDSVAESLASFFKGFDFAFAQFPNKTDSKAEVEVDREFRMINLIQGYRQRGHLFTKTNPVRTRRKYLPTLDYENFGLTEQEMGLQFHAGNRIGIGIATGWQIEAHLQETYCRSVGIEYDFMRKPDVVEWLQDRMEAKKNQDVFTTEEQKHVFYHLNLAVGFESFIHRRFVGQKRFSLEGTEALIPALDAMIERGAELDVEEFVFGMAHRGRLNVLANIMQKPAEFIFKEFNGTEYEEEIVLGDVKYHLGYQNEIPTDNGRKVRVKLLPNPSHLEVVAPITLGLVRGYIDHVYEKQRKKIVPVVLHGDAAIAAQGIVFETIQMANLPAYRTGGTIHIVINNQVGFTTNYLEGRSSTYCTDVAKVTRCPVFHVNGDDVEALIYSIRLAIEFRQKFESDVFIDILSYRKYGHNEGDEPRFTQPTLYQAISSHKNPRDIYAENLISKGIMSSDEVQTSIRKLDQELESRYQQSESIERLKIQKFLVEEHSSYSLARSSSPVEAVTSSVSLEKLTELMRKLITLPDGKSFFRKIQKLLRDRMKGFENDQIDWATAETLAYASLLVEGIPVRVSGQDSERGTFSHRHATFVVEDTDEKYFPLQHLSEEQGMCHIYNSHLSEYGVLGFEYGYALGVPNGLTIWEAQFGDFSNVAQVIFDQFICSAGEKWGLKNGLVLFLPHGYEGQGPEHSSARIERVLSLCADNNMQVASCTTPANLFHLLRHQVLQQLRRPLVVFTPKSLLRHPRVVSSRNDLSEGQFCPVIKDCLEDQKAVRRVVFTSGKLYFELLEERDRLNDTAVALIRLEQLFPFPIEEIRENLDLYPQATQFIWAQDEPLNMGAYPFIALHYANLKWRVVARKESGSPAVGLMQKHKEGLQEILHKIFHDESYESSFVI